MRNRDITQWLWRAVACVLVYDGVMHAATGTVWGRLKGAGMPPVYEGWPVILFGLLEAALGLYLGYRLLLRSSD